MNMILQELRTHITREGLSEFLPKSHRHFDISFLILSFWLLIQVTFSMFVAQNYQLSYLLGASIPVTTTVLGIFIYMLYLFAKEARKTWQDRVYKAKHFRQKVDNLIDFFQSLVLKSKQKPNMFVTLLNEASVEDARLLVRILVFWIPLLGSLIVTFASQKWVAFPMYLIGSVIINIVIGRLIFIQNDFIVVDLFNQIIRGWTSSWQAVLRTIPVLVITIFFALFTGDTWKVVEAMSWLELIAVGSMIFIVIIPGFRANKDWIYTLAPQNFKSPDILVQRVFKISNIAKLQKDKFVSIEDLEDVTSYLGWRDLGNIVNYYLAKFSQRIERRYALVTLFSALLLGAMLFLGLTLLFWILSPGLAKVGWLSIARPIDIQGLLPILKFSFFISILQMVTFLANLLDKTRDNIISINVLEKAAEWISTLIIYDAVNFPDSYIWKELQRQRNGYQIKGYWYEVKRKIIVRDNLSDQQVEEICKEIDATYVKKGDNANFEVYKYKEGLTRELEAGKENFAWHYIHKPKFEPATFARIPENMDFSAEEHLLGRENFLQGKPIQDSWFGNMPTMAAIGRALWNLDKDHHVVMHPSVWQIKDKDILNIEIRLFKKLPASADYIGLATKYLQVAKEILGNLETVNVFFPYRFEENWICDFQLTADGQFLFTEDGKTKKIILE